MNGVSEAVRGGETGALRLRFICAAAYPGIEMEVKCNCFLAALIPFFSVGCLAVGGQQKKINKEKRGTKRERKDGESDIVEG